MKKIPKVTLLNKILLKTNPKLAIKRLTSEMKIDSDKYEKLHEIFFNAKSIDFERPNSGNRGLIITIDRSARLFFYQDGDTFNYDGFEYGKYNKGEVTALDSSQ